MGGKKRQKKSNGAARLRRGFATQSVRAAPAPALEAPAKRVAVKAEAPRVSHKKEKLEERRVEKEKLRQRRAVVEMATAAAIATPAGAGREGGAIDAPSTTSSIAIVDVDAQREEACVATLLRSGVVDRSAARSARRARMSRYTRARRYDSAIVVYLEILRCGFSAAQVKMAMRATGGLDIGAALDWLSLAIDASELPPRWGRRIVSSSTSSSGASSFEVAAVMPRSSGDGTAGAATVAEPRRVVHPAPSPPMPAAAKKRAAAKTAQAQAREQAMGGERASWRAALLERASVLEAEDSDDGEDAITAAAKDDEARRVARWDSLAPAEQLLELSEEFDSLRFAAKVSS